MRPKIYRYTWQYDLQDEEDFCDQRQCATWNHQYNECYWNNKHTQNWNCNKLCKPIDNQIDK